ncbi:MAG: adenosylmethionine--8-amino-7-oxononanoate transaminase [Deltaproteobacteria bacterium]|nr:MAG: adenosylmethionine--8-amino-7-oxononanoate transaminase [Deltaproteobacteria bacterium]
MKASEILEFDARHIWHPYTSMLEPLPVYPVKKADGVVITLMDGTELIDGMSSWWSAIHGYNHPVIIKALKEQADRLPHIMFGGFTHEPAVELCQKLVAITPDGLSKVFLSDSGSVAVEVAMKMAMQYWYCRHRPEKNKFLTIRSGYHGDTFHAMSVCDPVTGMHAIYADRLPSYYFADSPRVSFHKPWDENDAASFKNLVKRHHSSIGAVILEPIVQGAGGMKFYHPEYLKKVRRLCDKYQILLIADEIATGLGRTGRLFACEYAAVSPDILCMGKTLTGGYLTLAATLCTDEIGEILSTGSPGVFMHGPTYMGNPLACRVAAASISLLLESDWQGNIRRIEQCLRDGLKTCEEYPWVIEVRTLGAIGVVELDQVVDVAKIQRKFVESGIWLRPFGRLVYIMPPYIIGEADLRKIIAAVVKILGRRDNWQKGAMNEG